MVGVVIFYDYESGDKSSVYGDRELRYLENNYEQQAFLENGKGYLHFIEEDVYGGYLVTSADVLSDYDYPTFDIETTLKETLVETKTEDGKLIVITEESPDTTKTDAEKSGYEYTEGDYVAYMYVLDENTGFLIYKNVLQSR